MQMPRHRRNDLKNGLALGGGVSVLREDVANFGGLFLGVDKQFAVHGVVKQSGRFDDAKVAPFFAGDLPSESQDALGMRKIVARTIGANFLTDKRGKIHNKIILA